jgi:hypothetical protein
MEESTEDFDPEEWPAARAVHMAGGCRAICLLDPRLDIKPKTLSGQTATAKLSNYGTLFTTIEAANLEIVGVDFIYDVRQTDGRRPVEWRVYHKRSQDGASTAWLYFQVMQKWGDIAKSAFSEKRGKLWDLAGRISYQSRVCDWRFRAISEAYYEQLNAEVLEETGFKSNRQFDNEFVWRSYESIHGFLVAACTLRDYLAEFAAEFIYATRLGLANTTVSTAAGLAKLLSKVTEQDELTRSLKTALSDGGWLKELGAYRDLVMHVAPLARAQRRLFAKNTVVSIAGAELPYTTCPMPDDPERIMAMRARGDFYSDFNAQWEAYVGQGSTGPDGLTYCHRALRKLAEVAEALAQYSPVPPKKMRVRLNSQDQPAEISFVE